ncbi:MAG TPA: hypothetical protein VKV95_21340 [Terriglobia bacterium]|nr:hypothetical protein [Terriglobia bacterium]
MPTLQRRIGDGGFFVRHFYRDHNTWQVTGEGVRYLGRREIKEGGRFSTELFMQLWIRGFVYYGNSPRNPWVEIRQDTVAEAAVRRNVKEFHQLMHSAKPDSAWSLVWQGGPETPTFELFKIEASVDGGTRLDKWKIADIIGIYELPPEDQSSFDGAKRLATVAVQISLADSASEPCYAGEVKQYWFEFNDHWRIWWRGFLKLSSPFSN